MSQLDTVASIEQSVRVTCGEICLQGDLVIPPGAHAVVLFAHGSGSGRLSSRNRFVAAELQRAGMATLLFDLLTEEEDLIDRRTARFRFDIGVLAERLVGATDWVVAQPVLTGLAVGYYGASTGAAAALVAAAREGDRVGAIVCRGGRPDLAGDALSGVTAPTLLLVGGHDDAVIGLNELALIRLTATMKELVIIPGASHLFEEPGKLEEVARLTARWFVRHLGVPMATTGRERSDDHHT